MVLTDVIKDKSKIMGKLLSIPDIFTYIHNTDLTTAPEMENKNIFSRIRIPSTAISVNNYICFDYSSKIDAYNSSFKYVYIKFMIVCHEKDIDCKYGNRHDVLANILTNEFSWSDILKYEMELTSDVEDVSGDYHIRTLVFKNIATNNINSGVRS